MATTKIISGNSEEEIWQQVTADLAADNDLLEYNVILEQENRKISLDIDIDPGGGFESGYEFTRFVAEIQKKNNFRFSIHHEGFIDAMGKLLGMEDVVIGYPEFDDILIVKTNDAGKMKAVFNDKSVRNTFQVMKEFNLHTTHHSKENEEGIYLELEIQVGITEPAELKEIYHTFREVLLLVDAQY